LWIVENGPALGALRQQGLHADRVLTSGAACALARNVALDELRARGGGYWSSWDDDDDYFPEYLSEIAQCAERADVTGKEPHFVSYDNEHLFFFHRDRDHRFAQSAQGGTLSGWSETALPFPQFQVGEDLRWCEAMRQAGCRIYNRGIHHYIYRRTNKGKHHHATGRQSIAAMIYSQGHGYYLGRVDGRIVTGELPLPLGQPVKPHCRFVPQF
jgi:hypothetical protein